MWKASALALAGCASTASTPVLSNEVRGAGTRSALFAIEDGSLGPITAATRATQDALQAALGARYTVKAIDDHGIEFHVFLGTEKLFYVIPNDDGTLFNVHATSPKVAISEYPAWVIGAPFKDSAPLTTCECWGTHPMCFRRGDHVAVGFTVACDGLDTPAQRRRLEGIPIQRAVWSPHAFGGTDPSPPSPPPSVLLPHA